MNKIVGYFTDRTHLAMSLLGVSVLTLLIVYTAEYGFNLLPCPLCLYQRKPYFVAIVASLVALLYARKNKKVSDVAIAVSGIAFLAGVGVSGFHTGVEQGWWEGLTSCGDVSLPMSGSVEELKKYLVHRPIVDCRVAGGKFLGISMTGYNFLLSLFLTVWTFFFFAKIKKNPSHD